MPAVAAEEIVIVVLLLTEDTVVPAGILAPVTVAPARNPLVLPNPLIVVVVPTVPVVLLMKLKPVLTGMLGPVAAAERVIEVVFTMDAMVVPAGILVPVTNSP